MRIGRSNHAKLIRVGAYGRRQFKAGFQPTTNIVSSLRHIISPLTLNVVRVSLEISEGIVGR